MIIPFLVFKAIRVLKMAVEVGLVVGITAAITPIGSAIFLFHTFYPLQSNRKLAYLYKRYIYIH